MPTTNSTQRHQPLSVIESYLAQQIAGVIRIEGSPPATLHIEPSQQTLAIRFPAVGHEPDLSSFRNLHADSILDGAELMHQLSVELDDNTEEAYSWLCSVLDRVQLGGESFAEAVEHAIDSLTDIIALRSGLTHEQRVGLFGELLVFLALVRASGPSAALNAWRGPIGEEHDFGLHEQDVEVKATLREKREHWISGVSQLMRTGDRPLFLVSVQLTTAAVDKGHSLPELVEHTRTACSEHVAALNDLLERCGFRDRDSVLYPVRWTLRTPPAFYAVEDDFPAITPRRLAAAVKSSERITDLKYRIDLTDRAESASLLSFDGPPIPNRLL